MVHLIHVIENYFIFRRQIRKAPNFRCVEKKKASIAFFSMSHDREGEAKILQCLMIDFSLPLALLGHSEVFTDKGLQLLDTELQFCCCNIRRNDIKHQIHRED